jgi:hypothetical protein
MRCSSIATLGLALACCGAPEGHAPLTGSASTTEDKMTQRDTPPTAALAAELAADVPTADRQDAELLLRDEVLPWELRSYPDHPRRDNLVKVVRDDLASALAAATPEQRLGVVQDRALRARVGQIQREAIALALRRYAITHPEKAAAALEHVPPAIAAMAGPDVEARAAVLTTEIDQLETRARTAGTSEQYRLALFQARMAAGTARTGSFATATGELADELRRLGERPDELRVH